MPRLLSGLRSSTEPGQKTADRTSESLGALAILLNKLSCLFSTVWVRGFAFAMRLTSWLEKANRKYDVKADLAIYVLCTKARLLFPLT